MEKETKLVKGALRVFIVAFVTFFIAGTFPDAAQAYFLVEIANSASLTVEQMTLLATAATIGLTCTCLFSGVLMDKFNPKIIMAVSLCISGVAVSGRGMVEGFQGLFGVFFVTGLMAGFYYYGVNKIISLWFPKKYILIANSIMTSGASLGFFTCLNTCGVLADMVGGWQAYFRIVGIIMVVIGLAWFVLVPTRLSKDAVLNESVGVVGADEVSVIANVKYVLKSKKVWCCIISQLGFGNLICLFSSYAATVLQMSDAFGMDATSAARVQSFGNIGSIIGYYVVPVLLLKIFGNKSTSGVCAGAQLFTTIASAVAFLNGSPVLAAGLFVATGFCNSIGYTGPMTYLMEQPEVAGLRSGTAIGVFTLIAQIVQIVAMAEIGTAFAAAPGKENVVMVIFCTVLGVIGVAGMYTLHLLDKKDAKAAAAQ